MLATTAFWFVMQAALTLDGSRFNPRSLWELPVMLLSFTIPFLLIADRGSTTDDFIKETADQVGLWAYASIYMGCVVLIMTRMLRGIRGRKPRPYILIRIGAWAILVASLVEIVYLTLRVAGLGPDPDGRSRSGICSRFRSTAESSWCAPGSSRSRSPAQAVGR